MRLLETEVQIDAPLQTVWSVLDEIETYPEWNPALPQLAGRTTVGQKVQGVLRQPNMPDREVGPTITRIVGARELRWLTAAPGGVFSAEHIFILEPLENGGTRVKHNEVFDGPLSEERWPGINVNLRASYEAMNQALKLRAETAYHADTQVHPAVGQPAERQTTGWKAACRCAGDKVEFECTSAVAHNHLCGCSQCWKPAGAILAQIAVVPSGSIVITAGEEKLEPVDPKQNVVRHRCRDCGTHIVGRVSNPDHHFFGLEFLHPELMTDAVQPTIEFAGFVSSVVENGVPATKMASVRRKLAEANIAAHDVFSPELMDIIASHKVKLSKSATL